MIYDTLIDFLKTLFNSFEFLKPYATTAGIVWLILKQHGIRKMINGSLPKRFRDTHESDSQQMKQDIEVIKFDVKLLKKNQGVVGEWVSDLQQNGSKTTPILLYRRFFSLLQAITIPKRRVFKMSKWTSRKFLMAILAAILPIINEQFNMGLDTNVIIAAIGGLVAFILGESHIDAKRAEAGDVNLTADNTSNK